MSAVLSARSSGDTASEVELAGSGGTRRGLAARDWVPHRDDHSPASGPPLQRADPVPLRASGDRLRPAAAPVTSDNHTVGATLLVGAPAATHGRPPVRAVSSPVSAGPARPR